MRNVVTSRPERGRVRYLPSWPSVVWRSRSASHSTRTRSRRRSGPSICQSKHTITLSPLGTSRNSKASCSPGLEVGSPVPPVGAGLVCRTWVLGGDKQFTVNTDLERNKKGVTMVTTVPPGSGASTPRAHLCLRVGGELERLQGESQALVRAGDELGSPEVSLTVQQTAVGDDNEMTLKSQ